MKKREQILLVTTDFKPQTGGIARWAYEEYKHLGKKADVSVLDKSKSNIEKLKDVTYFTNEHELKSMIPSLYKGSPFQKVLFFHWETARPSFLWLKSRRIPYSIVLHGWEFLRPRSLFTEFIKKMILAFASEIRVTSPYMKNMVLKYIKHSDKIRLTGIPIDRNKFKKYSKEKIAELKKKHKLRNKKVILSVGRLVERKDFTTVLKSIKILKQKHPDLLYVIIGDGPLKERLRKGIKKNNLEKQTRMIGEVDDRELIEWYNVSDLFVMTPIKIEKKGDVEGFGIVYHEAHFCGLPVIGSRTGGVEFALSLINNSYLIDPGDHHQLAKLIEKLLFS
ncbi:MAG: glycosyltransferase family 4 protein [Spirochaetes bacterium]|nr:glycosyltransferase family 4 protein [Spirochaetota bacterium]